MTDKAPEAAGAGVGETITLPSIEVVPLHPNVLARLQELGYSGDGKNPNWITGESGERKLIMQNGDTVYLFDLNPQESDVTSVTSFRKDAQPPAAGGEQPGP